MIRKLHSQNLHSAADVWTIAPPYWKHRLGLLLNASQYHTISIYVYSYCNITMFRQIRGPQSRNLQKHNKPQSKPVRISFSLQRWSKRTNMLNYCKIVVCTRSTSTESKVSTKSSFPISHWFRWFVGLDKHFKNESACLQSSSWWQLKTSFFNLLNTSPLGQINRLYLRINLLFLKVASILLATLLFPS